MSVPLNCRVMVVDDFESMRRIVKQVLNEIGFKEVDLADDGATALPKLKNGNYGFLVTDLNMPQMSGIDLVKAVRGDERLKKLPILMVTAEAKREQVIEAAKAGVNDYLVKPFTPGTLQEKIEKIFRTVAA